MQKSSVAAILLIILFSSCQPSLQRANLSVNGIWNSLGSGWVLEIQDSTNYSFYDITSISCLPNRKGSFEELTKSLTLRNDTLALKKGIITYKFTRGDSLPHLCQNVSQKQRKNPLYNFDVFAKTVEEHYAFFELNNINWTNLYNLQKAKLKEGSTNMELYQVIEETLEKLNDNHGFLEATKDVYEALENQISEEESDSNGLAEYGDFQLAKMVAEHHLQEEMTKDSWLIQWGKMTDNIGYIQLKAMWLFADLDVSKELIEQIGYVDAYVNTFHQLYEGDYIEEEAKGVSKIMDTVMKDLSAMEAIVIDVRFNGGGQDAVSFEVLNRFISKKTLIGTQKLRHKDRHTSTLPLYIHGTNNAFTKPVYVLTSSQTGSAAESFSIATIAMNNAKRIGSPTSGAISTALEKTLPNSWAFAISNEIFMDNQGKFYENVGVPVDYTINYSKDRQTFFRSVANDLEADKRSILRAINSLKEQ